MAEDPTTSAGQAPAATPAPTPAPAATNTSPDTPAVDGNNETLSLEEARKLRKENQTLRARQKQIDDAEEQKRLASLSENERLQKQHAELQQQHNAYVQQMQERVVRYEVERQAAKLGIIDPDAAARLLDWSELEYTDDGTPRNADKLLETLLKNKPYLAGQTQQQTTPAQQRPPQTPAMNPGRSTIVQPGQAPQGRPKLSDLL